MKGTIYFQVLYNRSFFEGKKNSVEIEKRTFSGFTIDKSVLWTDPECNTVSEAERGCCEVSAGIYQRTETKG